jgi:broad specificity phosphatase PhoE
MDPETESPGARVSIVHFITHPEVAIDPDVPVPDWPLSDVGAQRAAALLRRPWITAIRSIFTSPERKAAQVADMIGADRHLVPATLDGLGENDRSATGYLPAAEFEATADAFFAWPNESIRGWERAVDAQHRIVSAVDRALAMMRPDGDAVIVSHGGVGTLLLCHLKGIRISRVEDQPGRGGGNVFRFDATGRHLIMGWHRIEDS